jgi:hypothetical protein
MSATKEIEQLEVSAEHARQMVERREMVMKLSKNREFRKIILEGYFVDEAARLVSIAGEQSHKPHRDEIFDSIKAISHCRQFLSTIVQMGNIAQGELESNEEYLAELRGEHTPESDVEAE